MKKFLALLLSVLFFCSSVFAAEVDYPVLSGQVVDEVGILTPQTKAELLKMLSLDKDNQIAIAVLKDLRGQNGREYGIELARRWQLGQKGKDNGVLIFISPQDRYAGIEVGYGLEGILPDSLAGRILREIIFPPIQKDNDYNQAVLNGTAAVMSVITNPNAYAEDEMSGDAISTVLFLLFLFLLLSGKGRGGGGGFFLPRGGFGGGFSGFRGGGGSFGGGGAGGRF
ncbi:MAG: TPM domain-containing protein [Acetobacter sp.]|nr:TPM domain-containing protein [Acetobacter sp.]